MNYVLNAQLQQTEIARTDGTTKQEITAGVPNEKPRPSGDRGEVGCSHGALLFTPNARRM
jgi:hypothetical protein